MKKKVIIGFAVLLIGVGLLVYFGQWQSQRGELYYSGTIEATQSHLSFQVGGRVVKVYAKEGQAVEKGQILVELETSELKARNEQAQANYESAVKNRQQLETVLAIYEKTLPDDVVRAQANVAAARDVAEDARKNNERYSQLFSRGVVTEKERDTIKLNYDTAKSRVVEAQASLQQARSNLARIEVTKREIAAVEATAKAAKAAVDQTGIQLSYARVLAPYAGIITSRSVEPGEVLNVGREIMTLSDLSTVDLKIFVDETEIGKVKPAQAVDVKVDTFPNRIFKGTVSFISPEGEFTPKIIQTRKERVKLVYLVKVSVPNPDFALKSGMPADAWLR
jgi:HlyD family secretion protein